MLANLGDHTSSVAVYKVPGDGSVRELHCAMGGTWGSTYVSKKFVNLLEQIFCKDVIDEYRTTHPDDWVDFISMKFETSIRMVALGTTTYVDVPLSFLAFLQSKNKTFNDCITAFGNGNIKCHRGLLALKHQEVEKLFNPVLDNIAVHLRSIVARVESIDYLILVGGFAEYRLLQLGLRREFEEVRGVPVMVPRQCSLAVAKGAVLLGHLHTLAGIPTESLLRTSFEEGVRVGCLAYGFVLLPCRTCLRRNSRSTSTN